MSTFKDFINNTQNETKLSGNATFQNIQKFVEGLKKTAKANDLWIFNDHSEEFEIFTHDDIVINKDEIIIATRVVWQNDDHYTNLNAKEWSAKTVDQFYWVKPFKMI